MALNLKHIDDGNSFDFGRTAADYARYRDIYPASLYRKLREFEVAAPGLDVLDVGTGTGVLPRHLLDSGARFAAIDLAPEQIAMAEQISPPGRIDYQVSAAENTPFPAHSFDSVIACQCYWYLDFQRFSAELNRILKPGGRFCLIFMEWLPFEDEIASQTEELILRYNPCWTGKGYRWKPYCYPEWAEKDFSLDTVQCYREEVPFTPESWTGRMRSCRGIGASLPQAEVDQFAGELETLLRQKAGETFTIRHLIQLEIYRRMSVSG